MFINQVSLLSSLIVRGTVLSYKETRAFLVSKKPGGCEWVVWILEWNSFTLQRSPSSSGDTFRNLQWTPETVDSAEPLCIHYFPSYAHTHLFNLKRMHSMVLFGIFELPASLSCALGYY